MLPEGHLYSGSVVHLIAVRQRIQLVVSPAAVASHKNHADEEKDSKERRQNCPDRAYDVNVGHCLCDRRRNMQRRLHLQPVLGIRHFNATEIFPVIILPQILQTENRTQNLFVLPGKYETKVSKEGQRNCVNSLTNLFTISTECSFCSSPCRLRRCHEISLFSSGRPRFPTKASQ